MPPGEGPQETIGKPVSSVAIAMSANQGISSQSAPRGQTFQVRGSVQTILALRLLAPADPAFFVDLQAKVAHAPDFFRDAPIVLDVAQVATLPPIDLVQFCDRLKSMRLLPVGIQNASPAWLERAQAANLAVFSPSKNTGKAPAEAPAAETQPASQPQPKRVDKVSSAAGQIISQHVRGGQQIHNDDGDLVVLASVSDGAEIAAAGNIHVYGSLRGRAFAGTDGDESAMIFCDSMDAQLISIAGVHLLSDEIESSVRKKRVRIHLSEQGLVVTPVGG